ncbi:MAG: hypothetical protein DI527_02035 [Chelatococcus sp.]|nr:MAG: hypothetical protein DI527_02035 [Chelatococcus sp.]
MDIASTLGSLAGDLVRLGAPQLGGIIGSAIGGPAGTVVGGLAGKVLDTLAGKLGTPATPEAVQDAIATRPEEAAPVIREVEAQAPELLRIWEAETQARGAAQAAEIEKGFGAWQFWRGAWQGLIIGGWAVILLACVFGGGRITPMLPMSDIVQAWSSVTLTWLAVFNGGHTLKEIAPALGFGRKAAR